MQPISSLSSQKSFKTSTLCPTQKLIETIQKKLYSGQLSKNNDGQQFSYKKEQFEVKNSTNQSQQKAIQVVKQQKQSDLPELLDISKTQQSRQRQALLKTTIQSTIQQILRVYKSENKTNGAEQDKNMRDQIFQRFAFIFSEMNELKDDIQSTINYLNEGSSTARLDRQNTPNKKMNLPHQNISEHSQSYQEESMKQENEEKNNDQQKLSPSHAYNSLEQRIGSKRDQNSMEPEQQQE